MTALFVMNLRNRPAANPPSMTQIARHWAKECRKGNFENALPLRLMVNRGLNPKTVGVTTEEVTKWVRPECLDRAKSYLSDVRRGNDGGMTDSHGVWGGGQVRSLMIEFRFTPQELGSSKKELLKIFDQATIYHVSANKFRTEAEKKDYIKKDKEMSRKILNFFPN